jgi:hypothetical protein
LDYWLEFFYDGFDCRVVFAVVLYCDAEEFRLWVLGDVCSVDVEVDCFGCFGVEDCVVGFGGIWDEVVVVEVFDEAAEFCLCETV